MEIVNLLYSDQLTFNDDQLPRKINSDLFMVIASTCRNKIMGYNYYSPGDESGNSRLFPFNEFFD